MKKAKKVKPFFFQDMDHQEVVDLLNEEYPINIKYNEDLVNRVHARYPLITKTEVSIIVKAVFQSFRDLLVLGKVLNFNNFFFKACLYFFTRKEGQVILPALKMEMSTPPPLAGKKHGQRVR
jgi:hypothetical protein